MLLVILACDAGLDEQLRICKQERMYYDNGDKKWKCFRCDPFYNAGLDEQLGICKQDTNIRLARQYDCAKVSMSSFET